MASFHLKTGDTAPPIEATLEVDGVAVDLTGASVRFHMQDSSGDIKVDAAATVVSAVDGTVKYVWAVADTDEAGRFLAEWEVTFSDGTIRTFPTPGYTTVVVHGDIA